MNKVKTIAIWSVLGLTGLAFAAAGIAKLMGVPALHASFGIMGLPVWFGYFIGACELVGALGLFVRKYSVIAASGLLVIMLGAIFFHVYFEEASHALPVILLSIFLAVILRIRVYP